MAFFKSSIEKHQEQLDEEYLYAHVANEITNNNISSGLWTKAMVAAGGDEQKTKIQYIKFRFEMLKTKDAAIGEVVKKLKAFADNLPQTEEVAEAENVVSPRPEQPQITSAPEFNTETVHPKCGGLVIRREEGQVVRWTCQKCKAKGKFERKALRR